MGFFCCYPSYYFPLPVNKTATMKVLFQRLKESVLKSFVMMKALFFLAEQVEAHHAFII